MQTYVYNLVLYTVSLKPKQRTQKKSRKKNKIKQKRDENRKKENKNWEREKRNENEQSMIEAAGCGTGVDRGVEVEDVGTLDKSG